jgi:hypothetical protein
MATQYDTAGLLPSATLQPYGKEILKYGIGQLGTPINVGQLTPKVAGQGAFQQASAQRVADMSGLGSIQRDASGQVTGFTGGTGVASYQPYLDQISTQNLLDPSGYEDFMSPYQKEVIRTTMQDYDLQAGIGRKDLREQQAMSNAFGGSRAGMQMAQYQADSDRNRAAMLAGLYGQGYQQALQQQQQQLGNLQGMMREVPAAQAQEAAGLEALGMADQQLEQQKLNQLALAAQQGYELPLQRITDVANIYGSVSGAMPGSPTQKFTASPMVQGIGGFANMYSVLNDPNRRAQPGQPQ